MKLILTTRTFCSSALAIRIKSWHGAPVQAQMACYLLDTGNDSCGLLLNGEAIYSEHERKYDPTSHWDSGLKGVSKSKHYFAFWPGSKRSGGGSMGFGTRKLNAQASMCVILAPWCGSLKSETGFKRRKRGCPLFLPLSC